MLLDKSLSIALLISLFLHAVTFLPWRFFQTSFIDKSMSSLVITYLAAEQLLAQKDAAQERPLTQALEQPKKTPTLEVKTEKQAVVKEETKEKAVDVAKTEKLPAKIEIPPELPKEKETIYLDYYQTIREQIRTFVVKNYPRYIACGEVCLYFVLSSDGRLANIKVVEERSSQNRQLKEIAQKSVLQAAPFLPFPKDLTVQQLSFNVIVSFELAD